MILRRLYLQGFRNYDSQELTPSENVNFFYGNNAQGKSNLLEAIYTLAITRSFRTNSDRDLVNEKLKAYELTGEFIDEFSIQHQIRVIYANQHGKAISLNQKKIKKNSEIIGKFPVVLFSPENHRITSGPPSERRRFLDILLCQSSPTYLADLQNYNRVLRQRNALLSKPEVGSTKDLVAWDNSLVEYGYRITAARYKFVHTYATTLRDAYYLISNSSQSLKLTYRCKISYKQLSRDSFLQYLNQSRHEELRRRQTVIGPHRDDLNFMINEKDLKKYGSRGENKSALLALKIVENNYLYEKTETKPIILLDDLSSELDFNRTTNALKYYRDGNQVFVTSLSPVKKNKMGSYAEYEINAGSLRLVEQTSN